MNSKEYFFDRVIQESLKEGNEKVRILELGCGTASYVPAMIEKYPQVEYAGIEPIQQSFDKALEILKDVPRTKVTFQLGYDSIEGLDDNSFDVVISFSVLEHVKQLGRFLDMSARYVKEEGLMVHRYDLGHALYPSSLKERIHVWLGNTIPSVLPETKFVRYVPLQEVSGHYERLLGAPPEKYTYHQMPNHKKLEKALLKKGVTTPALEQLYAWEFENVDDFIHIDLPIREKLFPTVALWGRKK